jgi:hypothetical protein
MVATNERVENPPQPSLETGAKREEGFGGSVSVANYFVFHITMFLCRNGFPWT